MIKSAPLRHELMRLTAGAFIMGESLNDKFANDTERPAHRVCCHDNILVGRYPVTVAEYRAYRPEHAHDEAAALPVVNVTWHDAVSYCDWLSQKTGALFRLLSEAEWEMACRAGSRAPFAFGHDIDTKAANYFYNEQGAHVGPGKRTPVGSYPANGFGLHDMHGNVCEWVEDLWHPDYEGAPEDGSAWVVNIGSGHRVVRGGAWDYLPRLLRSSWRDHALPSAHRDNLGFRIATEDLNLLDDEPATL
ncbi:formylglycine-generating enzyme family protein [soil metagenome]